MSLIFMVLIVLMPGQTTPEVIYSQHDNYQSCADALKITIEGEIKDGHLIVDGGCYQFNSTNGEVL